MATTTTTDEGPRSFTRMLEKIADGSCVAALGKEQLELLKYLHVQACAKGPAGKAKGELVLKLKYYVEARGVVVVSHEINPKKPEPDRPADVFWLSEGKNLQKTPPKQPDLPFEVVKPYEKVEAPEDDDDGSLEA